MMNKVWKYALLIGAAVCMTASSEALGANAGAGAAGIAKALLPNGQPVKDISSNPAHVAIVAAQEFVRDATEDEKKIKMKIRKRISVRKKKMDAGDVGGGNQSSSEIKDNGDFWYDREDKGGDFEKDEDGGSESGNEEKIDAKLSKIKIKSGCVIEDVETGVVGEGVDGIISEQGKQTNRELSSAQRENYTSAAGTLDTEAEYAQLRQYTEQQQAIQMLAYATTVRKEVADKVVAMVDKVNGNYEGSDVKKDLDPESDKKKVRKTNDYNQALRQYAYYSLIYDQLLSLEQQLIGLRLQAKGALSEQKSTVISDAIKTETGEQ